MKSRVTELLEEIRLLEEELETVLRTHEVKFLYRLDGTRVRFEETARRAHRALKVGVFRWLWSSEFRNLVTAPIIYAVLFPCLLLDLAISIYQWTCFPLYRIQTVKRGRFIVVDRHQLAYMNTIEKFNCAYCGYVNGLIAYAREVAARTEQYWCPVKHSRKILDPHRRYARFADFGDSEAYPSHVSRMRAALAEEKHRDEPTPTDPRKN
jgi:hypothetical protein